MRLSWPLTGRAEELRLIESVLVDRDAAGVIVRGAAGVGKSRLAREALADAGRRGGTVRWLVGTNAARTLPLAAVNDWVGSTDAVSLDVVRTVIGELTAAPPGTPVLIGVDDVALLDDLSTFVVHQIVRRGTAKLVFTVRDGDPIPEATQEIWKDNPFERLALQPLSREETTAAVSVALGGGIGPESAARLWRLTRGNPLYLRNVVEHEVAEGRLVQHDGRWVLHGEPVIAPGLAELIDARLGALPDAVGEVIDVLALAEPLDIAQLTSITSVAAVEEADIRGLITVESSDRGMAVRVAHPLYGEVRRQRAAPTRLRRLRGVIATGLVSAQDTQTIVRRAALSLDSDLAPDAQLLPAAAGGAVSLADMPLADRLAAAAIRAGAGLDAYLIRSWALGWADPGAADAVLAGIPTADLTAEEDVLVACYRAMCLLWGLADPDGTKRILDEVSPRAPVHTRSWIDAAYVMYWAAMAKPDNARRVAVDVALDDLPGLSGAATSWALGVACGDVGHTAEARTVFETGYGIVTRTGQAPHLYYLIADRHLGVLLQSGLIGEAASLAEQVRRQAVDLPGVASLLSAAIAGRAALGAGQVRAAHALLEPVIEAFFADGDVNGLGYRYQIADTIALAISGEVSAAAAVLADLQQHVHPSYRFVDYERELARAWVAAGQGSLGEGIAICAAAAETACANGQYAAEVVCLQTAAQFGERSCAVRLGELAAIVEGPRVAAAAQFAAALSGADAAGLAAASAEFERIGDLVAAVDAAAQAARVYRRQGRQGSAWGCSTRAEAIAATCGALTPALQQAVERLPLTDREREIVLLLGQELSSPAIAERLTLSRRTVEGHIYRAMAKTGVASRAELAALLRHSK